MYQSSNLVLKLHCQTIARYLSDPQQSLHRVFQVHNSQAGSAGWVMETGPDLVPNPTEVLGVDFLIRVLARQRD